MASHQGCSVQHRKYSTDKVCDLEGNNMPDISVMPALDSRSLDVQARRKGTWITKFRSHTREFWAEFFGTAVLVLLGTAVNHQVTLGGSTNVAPSERGSWTTVSVLVLSMLGVVVSGGISGGHINPAVTLTQALLRGFSWKKVPLYWLAQFTGAFFGAGEEPTYGRLIKPEACTSRFLMSSILMMFIASVASGDAGNMAPPKGISPFIILWVVFALASTLGMQTSFALNPARDIGPRLVTWAAGYGSEVWRIRSGNVRLPLHSATGSGVQLWRPSGKLNFAILSDSGTFVGCLIYDCCIGTDVVESPLHNPSASGFTGRLRGPPPAHETRTSGSGNIKTTGDSD
ncbi:uncharacterized protein MELLADRAFT_89021 [Melampsora larici-populina 98AG31]|uniref:Aquaporin n=1 Tax=Melampsora larici-populina (strain 98AG31 / pathotype 3-4-7) TaxID=747676 RepID=F4R6P6_MELLP|nr:uncharacterized protein MELLADRAFT_89021 [Melampsora larici-populina 98AG31]EGG11914.1 hypothetical protein MELLADRAFT_89021 [Melampsora larici-populina 98AG31]